MLLPINLLKELIDPFESNKLDLFCKSKFAFYSRLLSKNILFNNIQKFCENKCNEVEQKENENLVQNFHKFYLKPGIEDKKGNFSIKMPYLSVRDLQETEKSSQRITSDFIQQPKQQKLPRVNIAIIRKSIDKIQRFIRSKSFGGDTFISMPTLRAIPSKEFHNKQPLKYPN
jgi:hypothetical protein